MVPLVAAGCDVVKQVAPRVWLRLRRDVRCILVLRTGGLWFSPSAKAIVLDAPFLRDAQVNEVALTLVHEATHARLCAAGIDYPKNLRERIERICVDAEIDFATRLPDAERLVQDLQAKLSHAWWTDEQLEDRRRRALKALNLPRSLYWIFRVPRDSSADS
jgi:hypothetical protein